MRKNIFLLTFLFFFLNIAISIAQKSLEASSAQATATTTGNGVNWMPVVATSLNLTGTTKVLVEAIIEVEVSSGNSDINSIFRLSEGTNLSQTISRYVASKTYTDKGIVAISFIFNYSTPFTGLKTFTLEHTKTTSGANKQFDSKAIITAIEIASSAINLPNGQGTAALISTSSTGYEAVATTNKITLEKPADIYVISTFSANTVNASAIGAWSLKESIDNSTFTDIPNSEVTRSIISSVAIGAVTIVTLIKNKPAGDYYYRLAHKVNDGTNITTTGATISAVALRGTTATGGNVFPAYSDFPLDATSAVDSFSTINSAPITAPTNGFTDNKFFMHASYNMAASGSNVVYAAYQFASSAGGTLNSYEIQRYVPVDKTGSGGLIGIVNNINQGDSFNASFQHKNSGGLGLLTTSNVNTIGFFLNSDPSLTLSIEENILDVNINIYPNPSQEQFYISNNVTDGETFFKFYTVTGQLVHTLNLLPKTNTKVDVTKWNPGTYILKATNNGITIAKKLIVE